jgi:hypothetical protein
MTLTRVMAIRNHQGINDKLRKVFHFYAPNRMQHHAVHKVTLTAYTDHKTSLEPSQENA